ncbi:MAG TPA: methylenetetrahydrofolate reductase [Acidimicrobiales bacterium]|nr:methylenetetrahydrofolate reductase [Acidimicrobiales bacterium]
MARIGELLATRPTLSFEFFPPKNEEMERALEKAIGELAELRPSFVSVTYGALGSTRERTRDVVVRINRDQTFPAMAHLTCVGHTRADVAALLDEYAANGVENILALGGDPPADGSDPGGEFEFARDLVEVVRAHPAGFSIGVAAHPELHPRSTSTEEDRRHLADKLELADFAVTQFFFDIDPYLRMVDELADLGCDKPILPGVMPFINAGGVRRMAAMNGTEIPAPLQERIDALADDPDGIVQLGIEVATGLCASLLAEDVPGLHLYALNRSHSCKAVHTNLGLG